MYEEEIKKFIIENGMSIFKSVLIFCLGIFSSKKMHNIIIPFCRKIKAEAGIANILNRVIKILIHFIMVLMILSQFHFKVWTIFASLGASIVALSVIFKDNLSNLISGMLILLNNSIHINDEIQISSISGKIVRIGTFYTQLANNKDETIIIPNQLLASQIITRKSSWNISRVNFTVNIKSKKNYQINESNVQLFKEAINKNILEYDKTTLFPNIEIFHENNNANFTFIVWINKNCIEKLKYSIINYVKKVTPEYTVEIRIDKFPHKK